MQLDGDRFALAVRAENVGGMTHPPREGLGLCTVHRGRSSSVTKGTRSVDEVGGWNKLGGGVCTPSAAG